MAAAAFSPSARSIPACAGEPQRRFPSHPAWQVYPRVCGGTLDAGVVKQQGVGLSPRVRGNPLRLNLNLAAVGSIPACAGEPHPPSPRRGSPPVYPRVCGGTPPLGHYPAPRRKVYPRVCGGTRRSVLDDRQREGLSPRVRGNPSASAYPTGRRRSIPACAGEPLGGIRQFRHH